MDAIPQLAEPAAKLHLLVVDADVAVRSACAEIAASLGDDVRQRPALVRHEHVERPDRRRLLGEGCVTSSLAHVFCLSAIPMPAP